MSNPYFSVVMPIYKVEPYLKAAIESVLNQTFTDFELLLVNDASPDNCGRICEEFAAADDRVRVFHLPQNGGLSNARNVGAAHAAGTYLYFMDSDDRVDETLFQTAYERSHEDHPHLLIFGAVEEYFDADGQMYRENPISYPNKSLRGADEVIREVILVEATTLFGYAWNKFYLREKVEVLGLTYQQVTLIEDFQFNLDFVRHADSMEILTGTPYHYAKRPNASLTGRFVPDYFPLQEARISGLLHLYRDFDCLSDAVRRQLGNVYVRDIFSALERNRDPRAEMNRAARRQWLQTQYQSELFGEVVPFAAPTSLPAKIMARIIKGRHTVAALSLAGLISGVKRHFPALYNGLKLKK